MNGFFTVVADFDMREFRELEVDSFLNLDCAIDFAKSMKQKFINEFPNGELDHDDTMEIVEGEDGELYYFYGVSKTGEDFVTIKVLRKDFKDKKEEETKGSFDAIIQQIKGNGTNLQKQTEHYTKMLKILRSELKREHVMLKLRYCRDSYNGRKICFWNDSSNETPDYSEMVQALISSGQIEHFLNHLVSHVFPLFLNKSSIPDYHF